MSSARNRKDGRTSEDAKGAKRDGDGGERSPPAAREEEDGCTSRGAGGDTGEQAIIDDLAVCEVGWRRGGLARCAHFWILRASSVVSHERGGSELTLAVPPRLSSPVRAMRQCDVRAAGRALTWICCREGLSVASLGMLTGAQKIGLLSDRTRSPMTSGARRASRGERGGEGRAGS
jgi:hypothetical protein